MSPTKLRRHSSLVIEGSSEIWRWGALKPSRVASHQHCSAIMKSRCARSWGRKLIRLSVWCKPRTSAAGAFCTIRRDSTKLGSCLLILH